MRKFLFMFLLAQCAGLAVAADRTVTLANGESAVVVEERGTTQGYVKSLKVKIEPGEVFSGVRIVKKGDGSCVKIESTLLSMPEVKTDLGTIQRPKVESTSTNVSCPT